MKSTVLRTAVVGIVILFLIVIVGLLAPSPKGNSRQQPQQDTLSSKKQETPKSQDTLQLPKPPPNTPPAQSTERRSFRTPNPLTWSKTTYACRLMPGLGITSRSAKSLTYMDIKLDILAQSKNMGMPENEALAMMDAVDGVSGIDQRILLFAGIVADDIESFQYGTDLKRQVDPSITVSRLISLLESSDSSQVQVISKQIGELTGMEGVDISNAIHTRVLTLLTELADADTLTPILRNYLNSRDAERFAAAASGLCQLGLIDEVLSSVQNGTDEMRLAFLQSLKWGTGSHYKDAKGDLDFVMTSSRLPNSQTFDGYLQKLASSERPDLRTGAIEALMQRIDQTANYQFLRNHFLSESNDEVLTSLLWNRSAYLLAQDGSVNVKLMELSRAQPSTRLSLSAIARLGGSMDPNVVQFIATQLEQASTNRERMSWLSALWFNGRVLPGRVGSAVNTILKNCNDSEVRKKGEWLLEKIGG